jgi:hypothetical protein
MSDYDDLVTVLAPFGQFDIASRFPGGVILARRFEPTSFAIDGVITAPDGLLHATTPKDARQYLLGRYEALLAALRADRWVLDSSPRIEFGSYLEPALWTVLGEVMQNEHEQQISARVDISMVRCVKRRSPHGHDE